METTKKTFDEADDSTKLNLLFDCLCSMDDKIGAYKIRMFVFASGGGIVGGFIAMVTKLAFWG